MPISSAGPVPDAADLLIVGTGFAGSFFLYKVLSRARPDLKVVVLEKGPFQSFHDRLVDGVAPHLSPDRHFRKSGVEGKEWNFSLGFGGSSNCWVGSTPRMLPSDFETQSRFGHGFDWPISYDDLEPYYVEAEQLMQIAGSRSDLMPASAPLPLPAHHPSLPEVLLARAWPGQFGPMPTARASRATATRPQCCANGVCQLCPVQAKFTIVGDMAGVYEDPRVNCIVGCDVRSLLIEAGAARGVEWRLPDGTEGATRAEHVVLAANSLFNPAILLRSGDETPLTGRRLHEQQGVRGRVYLDGLDNFQGSTYVTGIGHQLYADEDRRREMAPALIETRSVGRMRTEAGRWRQVIPIRVVYEVLPQNRNAVRIDQDDDELPVAHFEGFSDYTAKSLDRAAEDLARVFAPLPVERIELEALAPTESHIQGTTVMGHDPESSVVDQDGLHHRWRDVRVLGSSAFPTSAPANPTLTLSALALRSADRMESI